MKGYPMDFYTLVTIANTEHLVQCTWRHNLSSFEYTDMHTHYNTAQIIDVYSFDIPHGNIPVHCI